MHLKLWSFSVAASIDPIYVGFRFAEFFTVKSLLYNMRFMRGKKQKKVVRISTIGTGKCFYVLLFTFSVTHLKTLAIPNG